MTGGVGYPITGGIESSGSAPQDQQHFLYVIDKNLPAAFIDPLKATPGIGYELLQAAAKMGERVSLAIFRLEKGGLVCVADAGQLATVTVRLTRTSGGPAGTVLKGTVVTTSKGHRDFLINDDVSFGLGDNGPHDVEAIAIAPGYEWNVTGPVTTAANEVLPGEIDTIGLPLLDPPYWDTTLAVSQVNDATGGQAAMLEGLGEDRGLPREEGEGEDAYRLRVRSLPDVVTPNAIMRGVSSVLDHLGIAWKFIETFQHQYQEEYDAPSPNAGTPTYDFGVPPTNPDYSSTVFVFDDPRPLSFDRYANLWLGLDDYRGAFIIVMKVTTLLDYGMAYDDPGMVPADFKSDGYQRGSPAYDVTLADDPAVIYPAAYDGFDFGFNGASAALWRLLERIRAAGVLAVIVRAP